MNEVGERSEHPLIAVGAYAEEGDVPRLSLRLAYCDAIQRAGGVPLVLPPVGAERELLRVVRMVDGLVLTGGDDFDMERLGLGATHPAARRTPGWKQDLDVRLAQLALAERLPVLGICYGMQALALATGATLLQHLPEDRPGSQDHTGRRRHPVRPTPGSKLHRLVGVERLDVISAHHQAIDDPGPRWRVAALDDEGLVEALEWAGDHPFALGVQWHPEASPEGTPHDRIFRGLVGAAGMLAARRSRPPQETR